MVFVFFSILKCKTTRRDSRGSGGISMQGTVGGSLVSAHIGINMGTHYNSSNGTFNINFQENVGLGIGEKGAINISIPVPFVK